MCTLSSFKGGKSVYTDKTSMSGRQAIDLVLKVDQNLSG